MNYYRQQRPYGAAGIDPVTAVFNAIGGLFNFGGSVIDKDSQETENFFNQLASKNNRALVVQVVPLAVLGLVVVAVVRAKR